MWKTFHIAESEMVDTVFLRARREEIEHHNEEVIKNRSTLKTISEAGSTLASQSWHLGGMMNLVPA